MNFVDKVDINTHRHFTGDTQRYSETLIKLFARQTDIATHKTHINTHRLTSVVAP